MLVCSPKISSTFLVLCDVNQVLVHTTHNTAQLFKAFNIILSTGIKIVINLNDTKGTTTGTVEHAAAHTFINYDRFNKI